ncbi:MAG: PepSY domain-containing protein [Bacillota bacterium]
MKSRRRWAWITGIIVVAAAALLMVWLPFRSEDPMLTAQAAEQAVLEQYPGKIEETKLENGYYELQLRSETGLYHVVLDARSGTVDSIRQAEVTEDKKPKTLLSREQVKAELQKSTDGKIDKLELVQQKGKQVYEAVIKQKDGRRQEVIVDPYTGETLSFRNIQPQSKPPGKEDKDDKTAQLLTEAEASKLALVKVPGVVDDVELRRRDSEIPYYLIEINLKDGREATVEINAISGAVRSVTWDDDDPDDDDDE